MCRTSGKGWNWKMVETTFMPSRFSESGYPDIQGVADVQVECLDFHPTAT